MSQEIATLPSGAITIQDNQRQFDEHTLQQAIEVNRITLRQELNKRLAAALKKRNDAHYALEEICKAFNQAIKDRAIKEVAKDPQLKLLAKALSPILGVSINPKGLVWCATASDKTGKDYFHFGADSVRIFRNMEHGTNSFFPDSQHVFICGILNINIQTDNIDICMRGRQDQEEGEGCSDEETKLIRKLKLSAQELKLRREGVCADAAYTKLDTLYRTIQERLKSLEENSDALKADILRKQLEKTESGKELLTALRGSAESLLDGLDD